jgi:MFS family permease
MEQTFRYFNKDEFGMSLRASGGLLAFIGVMAAIVQGGLVRRLSGKVDDAVLVRWGLVLQAMGFAALAASTREWMLYVAGTLLAFGNGLAQPGISAYASKRAKDSEQGGALGVNQSASSLGRVFGPALGGLLYGSVSRASPYWFSAFGTAVAFVIALGLATGTPPAQSTSTQTS